jgi:hypothetical protein
MLRHILQDPVALLDGHRVVGLGRAVVVDEHHHGIRPHGQLADQVVMGLAVA